MLLFALIISGQVISQTDSSEISRDTVKSNSSALSHEIHFIDDDPFVSRLDQLLNLKYFENSCFITDTSILNVYDYCPDFIPLYDKHVYSSRLDYLNEQTPFSLIYNETVGRFIELYVIKRREQVSRMLGMAELYFPMFEELLDKYDLPLELKYLAVIESALNPNARSRSGAVGLWQFMYRTGKIYGLNVTSYIDKRRDPYLSTIAACEYLSFLYKMYDNWDLALAAYNSGPGRVNRAIRRSGGKRNYWELWRYLPRETRGYVPAFIAINYVMEYTAEHNLYPLAPKFLHYETDTVKITNAVSFKQISTVLDIPLEDIIFLNPVYKTGIIPGISGKTFTLTLPANKIGDFINNQLTIYNFKTEEEKQEELTSSKTQNTSAKKRSSKEIRVTHIVKEGEVLGLIAERYKCYINDIKDWNNIRGNRIYAGQKLIIYTTISASSTNKKSTPATSASKNKKETTGSTSSVKYSYHTVQPGDTLWDIAKLYKGVTVTQLKKLNNIYNAKKLKPGMKIKVSPSNS